MGSLMGTEIDKVNDYVFIFPRPLSKDACCRVVSTLGIAGFRVDMWEDNYTKVRARWRRPKQDNVLTFDERGNLVDG